MPSPTCRILEPVKPAGAWVISDNFWVHVKRAPSWLHRWFAWQLLGWRWVPNRHGLYGPAFTAATSKSVGPRDRQQTGMIDYCEGCYKKALTEPDVVKPRRKA